MAKIKRKRFALNLSGRNACGLVGALLFIAGMTLGHYVMPNNNGKIMQRSGATLHWISPADEGLPERTCERIETLLSAAYGQYNEESTYFEDHLVLAQMYARQANKGCPENQDYYKELALRELDIAKALSQTELYDKAADVVEVYITLGLKYQAESFFNSAKQTNMSAFQSAEIEKMLSGSVAAAKGDFSCKNGQKPNRYGCCQDEMLKDSGKGGFVCCPNDGGDCYPRRSENGK